MDKVHECEDGGHGNCGKEVICGKSDRSSLEPNGSNQSRLAVFTLAHTAVDRRWKTNVGATNRRPNMFPGMLWSIEGRPTAETTRREATEAQTSDRP